MVRLIRAGRGVSRFGLAVAAVGLALAAGSGGPSRPADGPLEGTWEIVSVLRDGEPDPAQVGAVMTFAGGAVEFLPRAFTPADGVS